MDNRLREISEADSASETSKILAKNGSKGCGLYNAAIAKKVLRRIVIRLFPGMLLLIGTLHLIQHAHGNL